jgi:hypothetical protein
MEQRRVLVGCRRRRRQLGFWLGDDEAGETAKPRHVSAWEKAQLGQLREILRHNPQVAAVMQPDPYFPALQITRAPGEGEQIQTNGIIIRPAERPTAEIPQSPADEAFDRHQRMAELRRRLR